MSMKFFLDPKSVAIVGASRHEGKVGHEIVAGLVRDGFPGKIFPVNPKAEEVEGLPCYRNLQSIGAAPDLVVIVVPPKVVPTVMEDCASVGVGSAIIITAGFKEVGKEGLELDAGPSRSPSRRESALSARIVWASWCRPID